MNYKCLVLDHDDTVVKSTPSIHYPSFVKAMDELRPNMKAYTLEEFVGYCFDPGFQSLINDILEFNDLEKERQQSIWKSFTESTIPDFYNGIADLILDFKKQGGYICVVSHSQASRIRRDYKKALNIEPDIIFGWGDDLSKLKPNPYPLEEIMKKLKLNHSDLLMVDDLKPGLDMARKCKVDFACAGWSHLLEDVSNYMNEHSDFYLNHVEELRTVIGL